MSTTLPGSIYDAEAWAKWAENEHHILDEVAYQNAIGVFLNAVKAWRDNKVQGEGKPGWVNPPFPTPPPGYQPPAELPPPPPKLSSHVGKSIGRGYFEQLEADTDTTNHEGEEVTGADGRKYYFVQGFSVGVGWYRLVGT